MDKAKALEIYIALSRPPATALKQINGGRLNGKTDINPQWRYKAMTEQFGLAGIGWKYVIDKLWTEQGSDGQVFAWAMVSVYVKDGEAWGDAVQGVGGNFLIEKEKSGLHNNDEGFKMAITDALGTALKIIGVAADIHAGMWDGSKYKDAPAEAPRAASTAKPSNLTAQNPIGKPPEQGMKERALDIMKTLGIAGAEAVALLTAHGGKNTPDANNRAHWSGIDWSGVLSELTERQRAPAFTGGDELDRAFNGAGA